MVSLVGFTTIFNKFKNNCSNIDYREMVKHSEKFIRSYNPDARKVHYIKGVANLPDAPTYDGIFDYVMQLGVDDQVGSHQGHLFYKGDSSAHLPIVNETGVGGFRFVHLIKFMIDDRIDDIFYINEPTSCVNRRCLNRSQSCCKNYKTYNLYKELTPNSGCQTLVRMFDLSVPRLPVSSNKTSV